MDQSTLYVDIENLQDLAKQALISAIETWPAEFPVANVIKLYVKADQTELWKLWAGHLFPSVEIQVKGVQHYTFNGSKNSADLFLALDAFADLLKKKTAYVAILSDDSDYASLFTAIKQDIVSQNNADIPFMWFMTNRSNTRSPLLTDFFPSRYIYTVVLGAGSYTPEVQTWDKSPDDREKPSSENGFSEEEKIARAIIQNVPVGLFKSADCKKIVARNFPKHHLSRADSVSFGTQFSKLIWPILERQGVRPGNPNRKPRRYEMTEEAKKAVG